MYQLREIKKRDLTAINQWRDESGEIAMLGVPYWFTNQKIDEGWIESHRANRRNTMCCAVTEASDDRILGLAGLVDIDYFNLSAKLDIIVGEGTNRDEVIRCYATNAMLTYAFENMNLNRIELLVPEKNSSARKLYERCGFVQEGIKRKALYAEEGQYADMVAYAILKGDICAKNWGGTGLPVYSMGLARSGGEKEYALQVCDAAFARPIRMTSYYQTLFRKIRAAADVIIAFHTQILGYCAVYANDSQSKRAYITLIAVRPEFQRMRIGKSLLMAAIGLARDRGMDRILLEVDKDNDHAIIFYRANGFESLGCRTEDKYLMCKGI